MSISVTAKPARRPDVWLRQAGNENALVDPQNGSLHLLNETALAIWELCDGTTSTAEMVEAIVTLFNMHVDVVEEDVKRILGEFEHAGLVEWRP